MIPMGLISTYRKISEKFRGKNILAFKKNPKDVY